MSLAIDLMSSQTVLGRTARPLRTSTLVCPTVSTVATLIPNVFPAYILATHTDGGWLADWTVTS